MADKKPHFTDWRDVQYALNMNKKPLPDGRSAYTSLRWLYAKNRTVKETQIDSWIASEFKKFEILRDRLELRVGTRLQQVIRAYQGLSLTESPAKPHSHLGEQAQFAAEFNWELENHGLSYPARLKELLEVHRTNLHEF